eukprot:1271759-Rhodomonas_salina.2
MAQGVGRRIAGGHLDFVDGALPKVGRRPLLVAAYAISASHSVCPCRTAHGGASRRHVSIG